MLQVLDFDVFCARLILQQPKETMQLKLPENLKMRRGSKPFANVKLVFLKLIQFVIYDTDDLSMSL